MRRKAVPERNNSYKKTVSDFAVIPSCCEIPNNQNTVLTDAVFV